MRPDDRRELGVGGVVDEGDAVAEVRDALL